MQIIRSSRNPVSNRLDADGRAASRLRVPSGSSRVWPTLLPIVSEGEFDAPVVLTEAADRRLQVIAIGA